MLEFSAHTRDEIISVVKSYPDAAVISIQSPPTRALFPDRNRVLTLFFDHLRVVPEFSYREWFGRDARMFLWEDAHRIVRFVEMMAASGVERFLVHSGEVGSRSQAVAAALTRHFGESSDGRDPDWWFWEHGDPNDLVYRRMLTALRVRAKLEARRRGRGVRSASFDWEGACAESPNRLVVPTDELLATILAHALDDENLRSKISDYDTLRAWLARNNEHRPDMGEWTYTIRLPLFGSTWEADYDPCPDVWFYLNSRCDLWDMSDDEWRRFGSLSNLKIVKPEITLYRVEEEVVTLTRWRRIGG